MLAFACGHCGRLVFFENTRCLNCSTPQGFVPERLELVALEGEAAELHRCTNQTLAACNWMVPRVDELCRSCELTRTRPNDADPVGLAEFARAEAAKRRVIFQLLDLGLPGVARGELSCDLLSSEQQPVTTGHADGLITIDLAESDDAAREKRGFDEVLDNWLPLTYALNAVNRGMGLDDLYPFTLAEAVIEKLRFVPGRVQEHARSMVV